MKIYLYNVNNKNQFITSLQVQSNEGYESMSTIIPNAQCEQQYKSYAFNKDTNSWDVLIDDYRGLTIYYQYDSMITQFCKTLDLPNGFIAVTPPDNQNKYVYKNGVWELYQQSIQVQLKRYEDAVQNHIDETAQNRGYDNGYTCASYYDDKNARYASDAKIFKDWRSDVWVYVNQLLKEWQQGQLEVIPTIQEVIEQLPKIQWQDIQETTEQQ